jgi:hypothetical protein
VDAAVKLASIGVPRPALWEYIGASPQQVARWKIEGEPEPTPIVKETVTVAATPQQGAQIAAGETPEEGGPPLPPSPGVPPARTPPPPIGGKRG